MIEPIISYKAFEIKYDFFYEKETVLNFERCIISSEYYKVFGAIFSDAIINNISPNYNLPLSGSFEFTGIIFKKNQENKHVTLFEAVQDGIPYYYPLSILLRGFYVGKLSEAELTEGKLTVNKGCMFLKKNFKGIRFKSQYYNSFDFLKELFQNKWSAEEINGYVSNVQEINSVDIEKRNQTNWRSRNFVHKKTFYVVNRL